MSFGLSPIFNAGQMFTDQGIVLSGGKINTYLAGSTTPAATYTDSTGGTPNANPIILGSNGRPPQEIWLAIGTSYKFVLTDSANNTLGTYDNLNAIISSVTVGSEWVPSSLTPTFVNTTTFSVPGDQTAMFTLSRRVRTFNTGGIKYAFVVSSTFSSVTTVVLKIDGIVSPVLDSGLSAVDVGILNPANTSLPGNSNVPLVLAEFSTGDQTTGTIVPFSSLIINRGATILNTGTSIFTAPFKGDYGIKGAVVIGNTSGGSVNRIISMTGSTLGLFYQTKQTVPNTSFVSFPISVDVSLVANETFSVQVDTAFSATIVCTNLQSWISVRMM